MIRLLILLLGLMIAGCTPYKTFYKETIVASDRIPSNDVYRLVINGNQTVDLTNLSSLDKLASLQLRALSPEKVDDLLSQLPYPEKLKVLILDSLNLTTLPKNILLFTNLNHISLNHNPNLNLDSAFKYLEELPIEFLNLQHNQLTELPESIVLLQRLKDLNLSYNSVTSPETYERLAQLPRLNSLWLTHNQLAVLPKTIGELSQLRNLYIEHNQLTEIPSEISEMKRVWVVHTGHNLFTELPASFATMPSLFLLHSNNCAIAAIPEIYNTKESGVLGLILDNNKLSDTDKLLWKKKLDHFFLISLE